MTPKERLLSAIRGTEVDRLPWSPFLAYYWDSLSDEVKSQGELCYLEKIGADPLLRGVYPVFNIKSKNFTCKEIVQTHEMLTIYETPVGKLTSRHIYSETGKTWFIAEHAVKSKEDFKVLTYMNENMVIEPSFDEFNKQYSFIGERALILPPIGTDWLKTPFQSLLEKWVGTEQLVYSLADYPEFVEECLRAMSQNAIKVIQVSVESKAEGFIFWEDSSTTNISPSFYDKYIVQDIETWSRMIHKADKFLVQHACGHLKGILAKMGQTGIDMVESISPPPTGNIELWEARTLLPDNVGLIGGIEPTILLNSSLEELEVYVVNLLNHMQGTRFILANSDSCPPGVSEEKFRLVSRIASEYR